MLSPPDLLQRRATSFVLWRPANDEPPPALVIGTFAPGNPPTLASERTLPLTPDGPASDLWSIALADCGLQDGAVYHYFFEVTAARPEATGARVRCTDPTAWTVDWRLMSPESGDRRWPAAVVRVENGRLVASDPEGGLRTGHTPLRSPALPRTTGQSSTSCPRSGRGGPTRTASSWPPG